MNKIKLFFSEVFKRHTEDDAERIVVVGAPGTIPDPATLTSECPRPWLYTRVLAFFLLTTALLFLANMLANRGTFSCVMVVGAFAVPFTTLVLLFELNVFRNISFYTVLKALFVGGALSLIVTAVLPSSWFQGIAESSDAFAAGIGEEIAKLLVVYWILKRNRAYPYVLNGLLVGAAVGAGFAIFETSSYAMNHFFAGGDPWLGKGSLVVLGLRNVLAPGGHVVWAALSGAGMLFAMRREPLSPAVFGRRAFWAAFLIPVALHVLWDFPFFESDWATIGHLAVLSVLAWVAVAWFVRRGLEEVDTLRAVVPFRDTFGLPPDPAGPWRRWAARSVDQIGGTILVAVVGLQLLGYFGLDGSGDGASAAVFGFALLPAALLLEWIVFDLFGTTFGKWAFSLRVRGADGRTAPSKAYFKRLLRLWVSGLGLGLPVVSIVAPAVQYRRVAARRRATYDESLGLRVDKERFRPLRWIAVLPILLAEFLLLAACAAAAADEDGEGEDGGTGAETSGGAAAAVEALADSSGLKYETTEDGLTIIRFTLGAGREQACFALPAVLEDDGTRCFFLGSLVAACDGLPPATLHDLLESNAARGGRAWCEVMDHVALRAFVPFETEPGVFRRTVEALASEADACEKELTGKDDF